MSKELINKWSIDEQKQLYILELEKRRLEIKSDTKIRHLFGAHPFKTGIVDAITILDEWFLKFCDDNAKVKKYLSFYYDCIKEGRYDKISEKIYKNRKNYEYVCSDYLRNDEFLKGKGAPSDLFSELTKIIPDFSVDKEHQIDSWKEFQDFIAEALFQTRFHVNILILGLSMSKSHPFIGEAWISNELGVLGDSEEVPHFIRSLDVLKTTSSCDYPDTKDLLNEDWEVEIGMSEFSDLGEVSDSTTVSEYLDYLMRVVDKISDVLSKSNDRILDSFLFSFLRPEDSNYAQHNQHLSRDEKFWRLSKKNIIDVVKRNCKNIGPYGENHDWKGPYFDFNCKFSDVSNEKVDIPNFAVGGDKLVMFLDSDFVDLGKFYLPDLIENGTWIYGHSAIFDDRFLIFQRGTLALVSLSSGFSGKISDFYLTHRDVYRNFTVPVLAFGAGYYHRPTPNYDDFPFFS